MTISKRYKALQSTVVAGKAYPLDEALKIIQNNAKAKFAESVDVAVRLGVDAKKSDQQVRGSTVLPAGTGKSVRVAVFCPPGAKADEAVAAGAEAVGMDDLAEKMLAGDLNYDVVIATPDAMRVVGKLGQVRYRTDKAGIIHCTIGKANFDADALKNNLHALLGDLVKAKPAAAKGQYLQKISLSSTMGVGVVVDPSTLSLAK